MPVVVGVLISMLLIALLVVLGVIFWNAGLDAMSGF
jgi:hypothetical protein